MPNENSQLLHTERKKILLVQTRIDAKYGLVFPLGLASIASMIDHHIIKGIDLSIPGETHYELQFKETLITFAPDIVLLSYRNFEYTVNYPKVDYFSKLKKAVEIIKDTDKNIIVIVGGPAFSLFSEDIMKNIEGLDFGIKLEGEETILNLIDNLHDPYSVKGVYFRENGKVIFTGKPVLPDFSRLPHPKREIFNIPLYIRNKSIGILTKRGCELRCAYCNYPLLNGRAIRSGTPENVVNEIEDLVKKYGLGYFSFADSVFNRPKEYAGKICKELLERNLDVQWEAFVSIAELDEESIDLMAAAGCRLMIFSCDGYSDRVLKLLQKDINKEQILKSVKLVKRNKKIKVVYNFFWSPPGQTCWSLLAGFLFYIRAKLILGKQLLYFDMEEIDIYRDTKIHEMAVKEGRISAADNLLPAHADNLEETAYMVKNVKFLKFILTTFSNLFGFK